MLKLSQYRIIDEKDEFKTKIVNDEKGEILPEKLESQKFSTSTKFFLKHSLRDIKRRKCHYCLAFCSVFIVVLFTVVINTIVARGPIIFLKMAEGTEGQIDGYVVSTYEKSTDITSNSFTQDGNFLNYSRVFELYQDKYFLSPRKQFCNARFSSESFNLRINTDEDAQTWKALYDN
jgi:hypothetical protein